MLPADGHVHSEWSWDAVDGAMEATCARALELGLPGLAFTEHADFNGFDVADDDFADYPRLRGYVDASGTLRPPPVDVDGYLASLERCRARFPELRILSGVELGDPHRDPAAVAQLLARGRFDRVVASLHSLPVGDGYAEPPQLLRTREPAAVIRDYLGELVRLLETFDGFDVLGHVDYAARAWPGFAAEPFEREFRAVFRALAALGRALEVNTGGPFPPVLVRWWAEEGGEAIAFGSDAHSPAELARGFEAAAAAAAAEGLSTFQASRDA
jgi:histidinol-phosphatase (PHP family)